MGKGGLSFLNKKSWHTATLRNAEKVWLAEQKNAAEETKLKQLRKEIEDERQVEHLRNLQRQHGVGSVQSTERLDWMYRNVSAELEEKEKEKEEYLLGKKVDTSAPSAPAKPANEEPELAQWVRKYENRHLDAESRIREDPMLVIMQRERDIRMNVVKNPLQMKRIREEVKLVKKLKKIEKSEKKLKKKEEKKRLKKLQKLGLSADSELPHDKLRKDHRERSEDHAPADTRDPYGLLHPRKVTAESSLERVGRFRSKDSRKERSRPAHSRSRSSSRSRSPTTSHYRPRGSRWRRYSMSPSPSRSASRSRSRGRKYTRRGRLGSRSRSRSRGNRRSHSMSRSPRRSNGSSCVRHDRRPRYRRSSSRSPHRNSPGRSRSPPTNSHSSRRPAPASRRRQYQRPNKPRHVVSTSCSNLSAEERAAKLAAMMQDANAQQNLRKQQLEQDMAKQAEEEAALREMEAGDASKTTFISDMNKSAFMDSKDSLEDRVSQRKHYRQKGNTDEHSFM